LRHNLQFSPVAIIQLFNIRTLVILAGLSMLSNALPFDTPRQIAPRQKKYSVINVDGGSTQAAQATTVVEATKTVEVVNPGPTITEKVTTIVTPSRNAAPTTSSTSSSTSVLVSTSIIVETPKPTSVVVTVTVPQDDGPTHYYDDGLWHTYYRIKSFEPAVATFVPSPSSVEAPVEAALRPNSHYKPS
jgi:spore germination protein YaaH